jgi:hypothetical protein
MCNNGWSTDTHYVFSVNSNENPAQDVVPKLDIHDPHTRPSGHYMRGLLYAILWLLGFLALCIDGVWVFGKES